MGQFPYFHSYSQLLSPILSPETATISTISTEATTLKITIFSLRLKGQWYRTRSSAMAQTAV
jgi:hypothetical protein